MKTILILLISLYLTNSQAEKFIPDSADMIVANWSNLQKVEQNKVDDPIQALKLAQDYLSEANSIGQSYLYGLSKSLLEPSIDDDNSAEYWLAWARIQGHQHNFKQAIYSLNKVLEKDPNNINANLMLARHYIIQRNYDLAESACLKLMGSNDVTSASICLLEAMSFKGKLKQSYHQLSSMMKQFSFNQVHRQWSLSLLADMAYRLKEFEQSEKWLDKKLNDHSVSHLLEWSDIKLKLNKPYPIRSLFTTLANNSSSLEDSIILRLALAEKQINAIENTSTHHWQLKIKQRIQLRQQRLDTEHAVDMAIYFIELEPSPTKALFWAQLNWDQAQEHKDLALLKKAKMMNPTKLKKQTQVNFARIKL